MRAHHKYDNRAPEIEWNVQGICAARRTAKQHEALGAQEI